MSTCICPYPPVSARVYSAPRQAAFERVGRRGKVLAEKPRSRMMWKASEEVSVPYGPRLTARPRGPRGQI